MNRFVLRSILPAVFALAVPSLLASNPAAATAIYATSAPTIDGVVSSGEWDFAQTEFDTGPRPYDASSTGWDLSGIRATFAWDSANFYGLLQAYPNTGGPGANPNGPFQDFNFEAYINAMGYPAALFLDSTDVVNCNGGAGTVCAFGTTDPVDSSQPLAGMVIEFKVPIANIYDSSTPAAFDPNGDFLEYNVATADPDAAGGYQTIYYTGTYLIAPTDAPDAGWGRLDFAPASVTPLPAALPLFGSGLGVVGGILGWRKRRKRLAQAAA